MVRSRLDYFVVETPFACGGGRVSPPPESALLAEQTRHASPLPPGVPPAPAATAAGAPPPPPASTLAAARGCHGRPRTARPAPPARAAASRGPRCGGGGRCGGAPPGGGAAPGGAPTDPRRGAADGGCRRSGCRHRSRRAAAAAAAAAPGGGSKRPLPPGGGWVTAGGRRGARRGPSAAPRPVPRRPVKTPPTRGVRATRRGRRVVATDKRGRRSPARLPPRHPVSARRWAAADAALAGRRCVASPSPPPPPPATERPAQRRPPRRVAPPPAAADRCSGRRPPPSPPPPPPRRRAMPRSPDAPGHDLRLYYGLALLLLCVTATGWSRADTADRCAAAASSAASAAAATTAAAGRLAAARAAVASLDGAAAVAAAVADVRSTGGGRRAAAAAAAATAAARRLPPCAAGGRAASFLLLFMGHSGSTAVLSEIVQHSAVVGAAAGPEPIDHFEYAANTSLALAFTRRFLADGIAAGKVPGFKLRPTHVAADPAGFRAVVRDFGVRLIWNSRANLLKQAVGEYRYRYLRDESVVEGLRDGQTLAAKCGGTAGGCAVNVTDMPYFHSVLRDLVRNDRHVEEAVVALGVDGCVLPLPYEEYLHGRVGAMRRVYGFLGLPVEDHPPSRQKATHDSLCESVANVDALCAAYYPCRDLRWMLDDWRNGCGCGASAAAAAAAAAAGGGGMAPPGGRIATWSGTCRALTRPPGRGAGGGRGGEGGGGGLSRDPRLVGVGAAPGWGVRPPRCG
ncbi:hypothetical protein BU14_0165s0015 [Porphyra umbilicalis]|uniref:Uncharacterized protein n=1 Tax=Porphyra umbilicalis TaxID=2786 RepID=A0A1X6P8C7_PORUM|nr:hypothetical protein BU14_0165s0015 [Porphyra umbilicalis]|eukprot:OSX77020.1 hypothetical protein BU14_0165s0015 [Porphyra umbilicalis]